MTHRIRHISGLSVADHSRIVETLRQAAALLTNRGLCSKGGAELRYYAAYTTADELWELAADLCEHATVKRGRCKYCEAIVREG